jgi:UDP-N-acetylmuramoyl-tripeptide--D-alanyl-D-alanine ligase
MSVIFSLSFITAASIIFFSQRLLRYLYHFQEGGYSRRYLKNWILENGIYDKKGTCIAAIAAILIELIAAHNQSVSFVISVIGAGSLIWLGFWENDPRKVGTPKLKSSNRAIDIYNLALALYSIAFMFSICGIYTFTDHDDLAPYWLTVIVGIQSSPIWLVIAKTICRSSN